MANVVYSVVIEEGMQVQVNKTAEGIVLEVLELEEGELLSSTATCNSYCEKHLKPVIEGIMTVHE